MEQKTLLQEMGLSSKEAEIYQILLKIGVTPAKAVVLEADMPRGTVYEILEQLTQKRLIEQFQNEKNITLFRARHPYAMKEFIESQKEKISQTEVKLDSLFPDFINLYNQTQNRPGVKFYEGVEGIKKVYENILKENKNFLLIRASFEPTYEKEIVPAILDDFIKQRVKNNISVTAITSQQTQAHPEKDKNNLFERQWVAPELYNSPVEINIYGDKVAFLSFGKEVVGMIIESQQIAESLRQVFNLAKIGARQATEQK